jgi:putative phage-type endonuclease
MDRQQWLEERKKGIGASDASAVVGMNPYKTNVDLFMEKTGRVIPEDIGHKPFVQYGINAEAPLRELFKLDYPQYEVGYEEFKIHSNEKYPFLLATLDGTLVDRETGEKGVLEIKTTNILQSMQKEKWNNSIPQNYYIQCLMQLLVTGWQYVILKAHLKTEWDNEIRITTKHYTIRRDEVILDFSYLEEKLVEFWVDYVLKDKKPPLILPPI